MKYRPLLLRQPHADEMVHAFLEGRKTQFRVPVKPQPFEDPKWGLSWAPKGIANNKPIYCERNVNWNPISKAMMQVGPPLGTIGDRLWLKEAFYWDEGSDKTIEQVAYRASTKMPSEAKAMGCRWTPSILMPRWASRIDLEITGVRVERAQDIAEEDAKAEGICGSMRAPVDVYSRLCTKCGKLDDMHIGQNKVCPQSYGDCFTNWSSVGGFKRLWQSIYSNWDANPWVFACTVKRIKP